MARLQADRPPPGRLLERVADDAVRHPRARWDPELCDLLGVDPGSLPDPFPSSQVYGTTSVFGGDVPVAGIAGDQQAALFGQACQRAGRPRTPTGRAASSCSTRAEAADPGEGLLDDGRLGLSGEVDYALEAAVRHRRRGAVAPRRPRDHLRRGETEALAGSLESNDGVYFVPALTGLGSPHWDPYARGTIVGLTRNRPGAPGPGRPRGDRIPDGRRGSGPGGGLR